MTSRSNVTCDPDYTHKPLKFYADAKVRWSARKSEGLLLIRTRQSLMVCLFVVPACPVFLI